ncbi:hypothetical protein [Rhizobium leguminosarum]|uniref:SLOG domain-containing protein n=1 Tax=Rhizobium leguminosarum TaxID=384 RepID=UPI003D0580FF
MKDVFLSASVPLPERDSAFYATSDHLAIRDAIKALIEIVLPVGTLTFGGHPVITPLISLYVREMSFKPLQVTVYQSLFFEERFPEENDRFVNLRVTPAGMDEQKSLKIMRTEMIKSRKFDAAVFIGGMEGVLEEYRLFLKFHPNTPALPIASTGAAACQIFDEGNFERKWTDDLNYATLFRRFFRPDL